MSYQDLFQRYGHPSREAEIRITDYLIRPDGLKAADIQHFDKSAAETIRRCETLIVQLREYRQALAERYAGLATMPYKRGLLLQREPRDSGIKYHITITRTYEDGTTETEFQEHFPGKQRREALSRFEGLKKQYPGIDAKKDIERRSWER